MLRKQEEQRLREEEEQRLKEEEKKEQQYNFQVQILVHLKIIY